MLPIRACLPLVFLAASAFASTPADPWLAAEANGRLAAEALTRSHRYLTGWLAHADKQSGLIPRNLDDSPYWNGRDAAADNYAYMVITGAMTDRGLFETKLLQMLATERKLTARIDRLADDYSFVTRNWVREPMDLQATLFDSAEYVKDGLLPITEWLGASPWSDRACELVDDIWKHATIETPYGAIPSLSIEMNGDLLQAGARLFWLTGDRKYLDWSVRLADYYLLGSEHPARKSERLRLRDHGGEILNGLSELYVVLHKVDPERAKRYRAPLHELFDRVLAVGRNSDGLLYDWMNPITGETTPKLADTWGYIYNGFYTLYLVDGRHDYRDAVRKVLSNLPKYVDYAWESNADGYADTVESALTLYNRERVSVVPDWIDDQIQRMWKIQRPDGVVEGWHGDGNFARTTMMYALWKSAGVLPDPWRTDVRIGGVVDDRNRLSLHVTADAKWSGRLKFDGARHRTHMKLPIDYPRINQFPEWYPIASDRRYAVTQNGKRSMVTGESLLRGLAVDLSPGTPLRIEVVAE
jgi:hypothetical protein